MVYKQSCFFWGFFSKWGHFKQISYCYTFHFSLNMKKKPNKFLMFQKFNWSSRFYKKKKKHEYKRILKLSKINEGTLTWTLDFHTIQMLAPTLHIHRLTFLSARIFPHARQADRCTEFGLVGVAYSGHTLFLGSCLLHSRATQYHLSVYFWSKIID